MDWLRRLLSIDGQPRTEARLKTDRVRLVAPQPPNPVLPVRLQPAPAPVTTPLAALRSAPSLSATRPDVQTNWVLPTKRLPNFNYVPARQGLVVFDTETTGTSRADRVVSLCAIQLGPDLLPTGNSMHLVFNPGRPSNPIARGIHGLSDNYLTKQPRFAEHAADIMLLLRGRVLVAHNLSFDRRMMNQEFEHAGMPGLQVAVGTYCTMLEYRHRFPGKSAKLDLVLAHFELNARSGKIHGAMEDTILAMQVLHRLHHISKTIAVHSKAPDNERCEKVQLAGFDLRRTLSGRKK
jgi:DNA polymerase-3 subunit epsilon